MSYFGLKVKFKHYLQKQKIKFGILQKGGLIQDIPFNTIIVTDEITQDLYKLVETDKVGIVIGRREMPKKISYTVEEREYGGDYLRIEKYDYVDCYIVYYQPNKKMYVPIDLLEVQDVKTKR